MKRIKQAEKEDETGGFRCPNISGMFESPENPWFEVPIVRGRYSSSQAKEGTGKHIYSLDG